MHEVLFGLTGLVNYKSLIVDFYSFDSLSFISPLAMNLFAIVAATLAMLISGIAGQSTSVDLNPFNIYGKDLSRDNSYGAPIKPWDGGKPAWYFGQYGAKVPHLPSLSGVCPLLPVTERVN